MSEGPTYPRRRQRRIKLQEQPAEAPPMERETRGAFTELRDDLPENRVRELGDRDRRKDTALVDRLLTYLKAGNTIDNAAFLVGIHPRTIHYWIDEGKDASEGCPRYDFYMRYMEARATAEHRNVMAIQSGRPHWQSAAWYLERRNNKEWGRKVMIQGDGENPIKHEHDHEHSLEEGDLDESEALAVMAVALKRQSKWGRDTKFGSRNVAGQKDSPDDEEDLGEGDE